MLPSRLDLERFFQVHHIDYTIPSDIREDNTIYDSILKVCEKLIATKPRLLSSLKLKNLNMLMHVAKDALFFTGVYNTFYTTQRPYYFHTAIEQLFNESILNENTFEAICRITTANLDQSDIEYVAQNFICMKKANLLTRQNIDNLVNNILNAPLRQMIGQLMISTVNGATEAGPTIYEASRAKQLHKLLSGCDWLTQADFNIAISGNADVETVMKFMEVLNKKGLSAAGNLQALIDGKADIKAIENLNTQQDFNTFILSICDRELDLLVKKVANIDNLENKDTLATVQKQASLLCNQLYELRHTAEAKDAPRAFLHAIVVVKRALPENNRDPKKADLDELMALGHAAKGRPSSQWKKVGSILMILGCALVIAAWMALTIASIGIPTPLLIGIGTIGGAGIASSLAGIGLFAGANARTGLSKNMIDLAESVQNHTLSY